MAAIDRRRGGSQLQTPDQRAVADRVARARTAKPPRGTQWYVLAGELAAKLKLDAADIMDEFDERAAVREYDATMTRDEAERLAWADVEERLTRQTTLL